jgi:hypothetical protein
MKNKNIVRFKCGEGLDGSEDILMNRDDNEGEWVTYEDFKSQLANHKNELFRMYLRPFLNKEGLIEPHLVDILIDRYNEEFEIETKPEQ